MTSGFRPGLWAADGGGLHFQLSLPDVHHRAYTPEAAGRFSVAAEAETTATTPQQNYIGSKINSLAKQKKRS